MLQSRDFSVVLNGAEMRKDGSFEIRDVAPGAYTILATVDNAAAPMMARQALQITSANVEGLRLAPQPGGSIRGRVRLEAGSAARLDPSQMFLLLRSADGDDDALSAFAMEESFSTVAHVNPDGSFEWKNVPAGHYSVQISEASAMPDWFLKSVAAGRGAADSGFSVSGGTTTLDLVASANGAVAEGIATNQKDEPVADAVDRRRARSALPQPSRALSQSDRRSERTLHLARPASGRLHAVRLGKCRWRSLRQP